VKKGQSQHNHSFFVATRTHEQRKAFYGPEKVETQASLSFLLKETIGKAYFGVASRIT